MKGIYQLLSVLLLIVTACAPKSAASVPVTITPITPTASSLPVIPAITNTATLTAPTKQSTPELNCFNEKNTEYSGRDAKESPSGNLIALAGREGTDLDLNLYVITKSPCSSVQIAANWLGEFADTGVGLERGDFIQWIDEETLVLSVTVYNTDYPSLICIVYISDGSYKCQPVDEYTESEAPVIEMCDKGLRIWYENYAPNTVELFRWILDMNDQQISEYYYDHWSPIVICEHKLLGLLVENMDNTVDLQLRLLYEPENVIHTVTDVDSAVYIARDNAIYFTTEPENERGHGLWKYSILYRTEELIIPLAEGDYASWLHADANGSYITASYAGNEGIWLFNLETSQVQLLDANNVTGFVTLDGSLYIIAHHDWQNPLLKLVPMPH